MSATYRPIKLLVPGIPSGPNAAMYGVELEAENATALTRQLRRAGCEASKYWNCVADGSLRDNGAEFVLSHPSALGVVTEALRSIYSADSWEEVRTSIRTSTHIHVNAGYWSAQRLYNFMELCVLLEPLLMQYVGRAREENVYCVPMYRAEDLAWSKLLGMPMDPDKYGSVERASRFREAMKVSNKYSAINVQTLGKFGTIEFRMAPLYADVNDAANWLRIVAKTSNNSVVYRGGALSTYKQSGINELLRLVYGTKMQWWNNMDPEELIVTTDAGVMAEQMFGTGPVVFLPPRKPVVEPAPRPYEPRGVWGANRLESAVDAATQHIIGANTRIRMRATTSRAASTTTSTDTAHFYVNIEDVDF